eukprot:jgi/Bigna1/88062/estExt_fgenesh1_pg.C_270179
MSSHDNLPSRLKIGNEMVRAGKGFSGARDSSELYKEGNFEGLAKRLEEDGYIWVRNVIKSEKVLRAREAMLSALTKKGALLEIDGQDIKDKAFFAFPKIEGWCVDAESGGVVGERDSDVKLWREVGNSTALTDVYNGHDLKGDEMKRDINPGCYRVVHGFVLKEVESSQRNMWIISTFTKTRIFTVRTQLSSLRPEGYACEHCGKYQPCEVCGRTEDAANLLICDICRGSFHLRCLDPPLKDIPDTEEWHCRDCANAALPVYTCWIPLGQVEPSQGTLAIQPRTHFLKGYKLPINGLLPAEYKQHARTRRNRQSRKKKVSTIGKKRHRSSCDDFSNNDSNNDGKRAVNPKWLLAPRINPGDLIMFNIKTVHAASRNISKGFRLSLDTRVVAKDIVTKRVKNVLS